MIKESTPRRLTAPAKLPVSLNEFLAHERVDADDDAAIINTYLAAATGRVDGWNGILGAALITQVWQADFDQFPGSRRINLPIGPVQSVVVKYSDADNVEQTFAGANYSAHEDAKGDYLWLDTGQSSWPGTYDREDAVRIEITAGYGDDPSDVPEAIRLAIIHTAAHWFTHREPVVDGRTMGEVPMMADAILENYRRYSF